MKKQQILPVVLAMAACLFQQSRCKEQVAANQFVGPDTGQIEVHVVHYTTNADIQDVRVTRKLYNSTTYYAYLTNSMGYTSPFNINSRDTLVLSGGNLHSDTLIVEHVGWIQKITMYMGPGAQPLTGATLFGNVYRNSEAYKNLKIYNLDATGDSCRSDQNGLYNLRVPGAISWFNAGFIAGTPDQPDTTKIKTNVGQGSSTRLDVFFDDTKILKKKRNRL